MCMIINDSCLGRDYMVPSDQSIHPLVAKKVGVEIEGVILSCIEVVC